MEVAILFTETLLWSITCWLCYRSGKTTGHKIGYELALSNSKDLLALKLASAKLAGRFEAWRELSDMILEVEQVTAKTHDPQVH